MSSKFAVALIGICSVHLLYALTDDVEITTSTYTTRYDNINLNDLMKNDRLRRGYVNCLLNEGPCTPDGSELKKNLPDAIENNCLMCSELQREGSSFVTHYLIDHHPEEWARLEKIYDISGEYRKQYLESRANRTEEEADTSGAITSVEK